MLQADVLVVENEQEVFTAMVALKHGHGSFADALIAELGIRAGCASTLTFDHKALRLPGDVKGLKMRIQSSKVLDSQIRAQIGRASCRERVCLYV